MKAMLNLDTGGIYPNEEELIHDGIRANQHYFSTNVTSLL